MISAVALFLAGGIGASAMYMKRAPCACGYIDSNNRVWVCGHEFIVKLYDSHY